MEYAEVRDVFWSVVEIEGDQRQQETERRCQGDPALMHEVEDLLRHHDVSEWEGFLTPLPRLFLLWQ